LHCTFTQPAARRSGDACKIFGCWLLDWAGCELSTAEQMVKYSLFGSGGGAYTQVRLREYVQTAERHPTKRVVHKVFAMLALLPAVALGGVN